MSRAHSRVLLLLLLAGLPLGCIELVNELNRTSGNSRLGFFHIVNHNLVARGAKLDLFIHDWEGTRFDPAPAHPRNVTSSNEELVSIEEVDGDRVTVIARTAGSVRISFDAEADGERLEDSFELHVVEPEFMHLERCDTDGVYVRGEAAFLLFHFTDQPFEGAQRWAHGYGFYPLELTGNAAIDPANREPYLMRLDVAEDAGQSVHLRSALAGDPSELTLELVDPSQLTSVELTGPEGRPPDGRMRVSDSRHLLVTRRAGGRTVCSATDLRVHEETPEVCRRVRDRELLSFELFGKEDAGREAAWNGPYMPLTIIAVREGTCRVTLTRAGARDGFVNTFTFSAVVEAAF